MLTAFSYAFMQRALIIGLIVGLLCAVLSVFIVLKRWAFIGEGISHAAFGGVAIGLLLGQSSITFTTIIFCLTTAYLIGLTSRGSRVSADSAIGIFLVASMALGVLILALRRNYSVDIFGYLFGNLLATDNHDVTAAAIVAIVVLGFIVIFFKEISSFTFDPVMAEASGLPVRLLHYGLLTAIALTVVIAVRVVGLILVSALLILPAATARPLARHLLTMMLIAIGITIICVSFGLWSSYALNTPSGATIVLALFVVFLLSLMFGRSVRQHNN
ncbi:MAG: metal ABC transporter permease [Deltaproteobacteria bacterium]|nr:metal ABC transporter permease [Deltaproteobacteria bacterium]